MNNQSKREAENWLAQWTKKNVNLDAPLLTAQQVKDAYLYLYEEAGIAASTPNLIRLDILLCQILSLQSKLQAQPKAGATLMAKACQMVVDCSGRFEVDWVAKYPEAYQLSVDYLDDPKLSRREVIEHACYAQAKRALQALQAQPQAAAQGEGEEFTAQAPCFELAPEPFEMNPGAQCGLPVGHTGAHEWFSNTTGRSYTWANPPSQPCQICGGSGVLPKGGDKGSTRYACKTCHGTGHISAPPPPSTGESLLMAELLMFLQEIDNASNPDPSGDFMRAPMWIRRRSSEMVKKILKHKQHLANGGK